MSEAGRTAVVTREADSPLARRPGPQSLRNHQERNFWGPVAAVVGTAMFAAGVWLAAGGRGPRFDRQEELFGGLFFAACGLLCVYGASVIWGRGRPKRDPRLRGASLAVSPSRIRRGDEVSIALTRAPEVAALEVGLACVERADVSVRVNQADIRQTVETTVHEEWQAVPAGAVGSFAFRVPAESPYSYEGECLSIAWRMSVRAVRTGQPDERLDEPIWVEP